MKVYHLQDAPHLTGCWKDLNELHITIHVVYNPYG